MTFKTINNTTPFFEGTDTYGFMGHSSYSTTGTTSFTAIHTDVAGQEYVPFGAPATTNGPRRIDRDDFIENENNGNAVGKDEEVPTGDMLLPLLVMAGCMILFKCISTIKNSRAMKKFFSLFVFSLLSVGALTAQNNYLQDGDVVSISTNITNGGSEEGRRYLDNYAQTQNNVNDNCLWRLGITNGQYTFQSLSTNQYLSVYIPGDPQSARLVMAANPTPFSFIPTGNGGEDGKYLCGSFSYSFFYQPWNNTYAIYIARYWGQSFTSDPWNANTTLYIEKWEKKGGSGGPTGFFTPEKAEFTYAKDGTTEAKKTQVSFTLRSQIESYYECVTREEILLRRQTETIDLSEVTPTFYWESSKNETSTLDLSKYNTPHTETGDRAMMLISNATTNGQTSSFYITPQGGSPMGLKQNIYSEGDTIQGIERWVDYADRVIAEYVVNGKTYKETMRVVRKSYHEEELPSLVFSINPVTYTFAQNAESVDINITPTHQHGRVLYNSDNQEISIVRTEGPTPIPLTDENWQLSIDFTNNDPKWLSGDKNGDYKIKVTADANNTGAKRSSVLTGTFTKINGSDTHSGKFTIPLAQRSIEGGIQFHTKGINGTDPQQVHTSERTIYYLRNEEIELRPAESGYSGYMRWYDYKTGMDPYYNELEVDSTSWILSPRAASGAAFSAINTPQNNNTYGADGRSYGLYAINKAEGGVLNEDNPANPAPKIKGWNYTSAEHASHTIACDMSAYRDYVIKDTTFANGEKRIQSITEPTLSYRQLFHLKPAEEIANKFANLQEGQYLEEYHYQAPVGKTVLLATEFRFNKVRSHKSEMCYFYRGSDEKLHRIESGTKWFVSTLQADGTYSAPAAHTPTYTSTMDYLVINSTAPQTQIYTLVLPKETANTSTDLRIARFTVTFVPVRECGPTNEVLITPQRINSEFKRLATIDFNANTNHLPWNESSYGFVYTSGELATNTKYARGASQGVFPFYGEYMLTPQVNKDWARASAKTGNALYVDGTMEPGLVASISANTVICSGQTLYCSAWFCNPTPQAWNSEGNPIFRCNVQGRNITNIQGTDTTFTPWTDVEAYFVGELPKNSGWQQINFPIVSAHNYDQTRVAIYNFATTNLGNDFMVDDITLYVSQLPIAAYQGKMACRSIDSNNTSAAAVLRIDYSMIEPGGDGFMYYQIYNNSYENGGGKPDGAPVVLEEKSAYYHDNTYDHDHNNTKNEYGSVTIPDQHFDPEVYNADKNTLQKVAIYQSVSKFLDELVENKKEHGKAYVKTENNGVTKWLLYVAHIIPNTDKHEESLRKLYDRHSYSMRMAYTPGELEKPECNLQTPIHATQQTVFELRNSANNIVKQRKEDGGLQKITDSNGQEQVVTRFFTHSIQNCANDLYFLDIKVINNLAVSTGDNINKLEAPIYADWLIGDSIDDIYGQVRPTDAEELKKYLKKAYAADSIFKLKHGGYTHGQVTTAIMYDMRRIPSDDNPNPNYYAKTFEELDPNAFLSPQNYTIVKYLHDNELLQMYTPTVHFYLASQDTARYWAFPIAETAKVVSDEKTIVLKDCNEPRWVTVSSQSSDYFLNITPLDKKHKTLHQRTQIPTVKVVAKNSNQFAIPVKEITTDDKVKINGTTYAKDATITINLPSLPTGFEFYDIEQSKVIGAPSELLPGETYTMRVAFQEENGYNYPGNNSAAENACRIGFVFFNIEVVPNTLVWTPTGTSMNGWGKNENWKGWIDTNGDHKIDYNTELVEGFVPMDGTDVIIPNLQKPLIYPYIVPVDEHDHYPMTHYHDQHKCDKIYFAEGAHMNNQHLLQYEAAFVDMTLPQQGEWYMMSAPLQNMVSGDMFIPHEGDYKTGSIFPEPNPFEVSSFRGTRDNIAAYAFWTAFYNQTVKTWYEDGSAKESTSAEFQQSNGLGNLLPPGGGFQLLGFGPNAKPSETLTIRLPKPDTQYFSSSNREVNVDKTNAKRLAFTPDTNGNMTITLTNAIEGNSFIFGNPTMAFINMHDFLHDNESVLSHEFYRLSGSTWTAVNASTMSSSERFLAPMSAVKLVAKKNTKSLTITLKTSHLTLNNQYNPLSETVQEQKNATKHTLRQVPSQNEAEEMPEMLTVYAFAKGNHARTILVVDNQANDYYVQGEDMLFISSGVEGNSTSVVETPVNMYTAAEKTPMMVDVRQGISQIPLGFLMAKNKKADTFELAFYLSPNWTRTCYLFDKVTGQRRRIMNGSIFTLPMPANHEERYIIEGPDEYISEEDKPSISTDFDTQTAPDTKAYKVLHNQQIYILHNGHTYTLTGLEVKW